MGGAREARCSANESLGAVCCAAEVYQATMTGVSLSASRAASSAGMCSAWQRWQAVSGPFECSWKTAAPTAKHSKAAQASSATVRRENSAPELISQELIKDKDTLV